MPRKSTKAQPEEIVVGRYYFITKKSGQKLVRYAGQLIEDDGTTQKLRLWKNGKPGEELLEIPFKKHDVREVTATGCADHSQTF